MRIFFLIIVAAILTSCKEEDESKQIDNWAELKPFPGGKRTRMFSFSVDGVGFVGGGYFFGSGSSTEFHDIWQYSQETDQWENKGDLPFLATVQHTFVVDKKAYLLVFGSKFYEYNVSNDPTTGLSL